MLSLKEACRYQNYFNNLIKELNRLKDMDYIYKIKEIHKKSEVLKDAKDEEKERTTQKIYDVKLEKIINIMNDLYNEKLKLSQAINKAKSSLVIEYTENGEKLFLDSAVEYNKNMREFADGSLKGINSSRNIEHEHNGNATTFNNEGNVVIYEYPIKFVHTIDFDKKATTKLHKKILSRCDIISEQIDEAMLKKVVDYTPKYDLQTDLDDLLL